MIKLKNQEFKIDSLEKRAFSTLFRRLCKFSCLTLGSVYQILSGVRIDGIAPAKLNKKIAKQLLSNWHRKGFIKISKGRVKVGANPFWHQLLTEKVLTEIADYDARYWLSYAPHGLKPITKKEGGQ